MGQVRVQSRGAGSVSILFIAPVPKDPSYRVLHNCRVKSNPCSGVLGGILQSICRGDMSCKTLVRTTQVSLVESEEGQVPH